VGSKEEGLIIKYHVSRQDGRDLVPGDKHYDCDYFVLDLDHDPYAYVALAAYADECEKYGYGPLAADIRKRIMVR